MTYHQRPVIRHLPRQALLLALISLLAACGGPRAPADPTQPPLPLAATRTPAERPTTVSQGPDLPGRLVFAAGGDLWLWEGAGGRRITTEGDAAQPAFAPDGAKIAFVRRNQSASDLVLLDIAAGELLPLTFYTPDLPPGSIDRVYSSIWALYPAWARDGGEIGFVSQYGPPYGSPATDYRLGLYAMLPQPGADRSMLYTDQAGQVGRLAYTPDGSAIMFGLAPDTPGAPKVYRYDRASGEVGEIPGVPEQSYDPAVSPDGSQLAFAARHEGGTDIFLMPLAGGEPRRITGVGTARAPAFSPDGAQIAFLAAGPERHGFDLWVVELTPGAQPRQISYDMGIDADSGVTWAQTIN